MFKEILKKYIGQLMILTTVIGLVLFGYGKWRDANEEKMFANLVNTQTKYEQLTRYTAKLESDYRSQQEISKMAEQSFAEYKKGANERIKVLSDATYLIGKHVQKQNGPDYYFSTKKQTQNYILNELKIAGENSPSIGYVLIRSNGKTYKRNYKFEINVKNLHTVDEKTGRINIVSKAFLVKRELSPLNKRVEGYDSWLDKPYPLEITGGKAIIDPTVVNTKAKLRWWSPHINGGFSLGVGAGEALLRPSLDFSTSGYGKSRNDLDWKFLHIGFDTDTEFKKPGIHLIPFSYRFWPSVMTNSYVGPGIGFIEDGINYQLNLNLSF